MSEFRPRLPLLCFVALLALVGAFGVRAGFTTEPGLRAAQAWLVSPLPGTGAVKVADKSETANGRICVVGDAHRIRHTSPRLNTDR